MFSKKYKVGNTCTQQVLDNCYPTLTQKTLKEKGKTGHLWEDRGIVVFSVVPVKQRSQPTTLNVRQLQLGAHSPTSLLETKQHVTLPGRKI